LTCVQSLWSRRSDGWFAGCGLAAAVACSGVWGGGFKALAGGPSACCGLDLCGSSFWFCRVSRGWPTPVHGSGLALQHDFPILGANPYLDPVSLPKPELECAACPAKGGVDTVHTYV